jgi:hypothetical protein
MQEFTKGKGKIFRPCQIRRAGGGGRDENFSGGQKTAIFPKPLFFREYTSVNGPGALVINSTIKHKKSLYANDKFAKLCGRQHIAHTYGSFK